MGKDEDARLCADRRRIWQREVRTEMAEWANKFEWQIYMTGTFKRESSYRDAIKTKRAFRRFTDEIKRVYGKKAIEYFMCVELHKEGSFTHVHALINGLDALTYNQIRETWEQRFGRAKVEGYDKEKGAHYYLTKYILKDVHDWDIKIDQKKAAILNFEQ